MSDYEKAIASICLPERSPFHDHLHKPFRTGDDMELVMATDGKAMLLLHMTNSPTIDFGETGKMPPWRPILRTGAEREFRVSRVTLDDFLRCEPRTFTECDTCETADGQMMCPECGGTGHADPDEDDIGECAECDGEGHLTCPTHDPGPHVSYTSGPQGRINGIQFNRFLAWTTLQHLTGELSIFTDSPMDYIEFRGDEGWRFILMPLRDDGAECPELIR